MLGPRVLTVDPLRLDQLDGCDISTPATTQLCDPNAQTAEGGDPLEDSEFFPRPVGGTSVAEASVELRFPVWRKFTGAVFLDGAIINRAGVGGFGDVVNIASFSQGTAALTPGFGIRYHTRVGPIRVDLGYNPTKAERYLVVTESCAIRVDSPAACPPAERLIVPLNEQRRLTAGPSFFERMTLHLSIGQAY
jgi:hypothetical protein